MRPISFLLVAAAALLASCESLSVATDSAQTKLSMTSTTDTVQQLNAPHGGKRFLRTTKETLAVDEDEDVDDDDEEEEERNALTPYVSRNGQAWVDKWVLRSSNRVNDKFIPKQIKAKYHTSTGWRNGKARDKYNLFLAAWLKKHPGGT